MPCEDNRAKPRHLKGIYQFLTTSIYRKIGLGLEMIFSSPGGLDKMRWVTYTNAQLVQLFLVTGQRWTRKKLLAAWWEAEFKQRLSA